MRGSSSGSGRRMLSLGRLLWLSRAQEFEDPSNRQPGFPPPLPLPSNRLALAHPSRHPYQQTDTPTTTMADDREIARLYRVNKTIHELVRELANYCTQHLEPATDLELHPSDLLSGLGSSASLLSFLLWLVTPCLTDRRWLDLGTESGLPSRRR